MWYLIIPPIIIILSLALLLWYLSRRSNDPAVLEKIEKEEPRDKKAAFLKTKNFFLKLLEKMTLASKVRTLKMHNAIGAWSQSLKKKREMVSELAALQKRAVLQTKENEEPGASRLRFWRRFQKKVEPETKKTPESEERPPAAPVETEQQSRSQAGNREEQELLILREPLIRRRERLFAAASEITGPDSDVAPEEHLRPMVSETVTEPEVRRKKQRQNVAHEETLIERIAENPKDFTAYEALGDYYMSMENTRDAKECYRQVLKLRPVHRLVKIKIRRLEKILTDKA